MIKVWWNGSMKCGGAGELCNVASNNDLGTYSKKDEHYLMTKEDLQKMWDAAREMQVTHIEKSYEQPLKIIDWKSHYSSLEEYIEKEMKK